MATTLIFDMDGTLIDSNHLVEEIYQKLIRTYPPTHMQLEAIDRGELFALSYHQVLNKLYGTSHVEHMDYIMECYHQLRDQHIKLFPGIMELLIELKESSYRLGLVTSEIKEIAIDELKYLGIHHFFDDIVTFDDVKKGKPDPEGLIKVMKSLNKTPEEVIYIGDQKSDGVVAYQAHVYAILMDWYNEKSTDYYPYFDHIASDKMSLLKIIDRHKKMVIKMPKHRDLKILQLTDLHLMNDEKDQKTYQLIKDMIAYNQPDFIAITGDQTMSDDSVVLYKDLGFFMDQFEIPYTYVFGNHDIEGAKSYDDLIQAIEPSKCLLFDQGPRYLGFSNGSISIQNDQGKTIGLLVMLDTHIDKMYPIDGKLVWGYDGVSEDQIKWYQRLIHRLPFFHLFFFHIPIIELHETKPGDNLHEGEYLEVPSTPPINTGFFEAARKTHLAKAMFFGHDHYNDFSYVKEGIILAHGRVSGHYDYGAPGFPRGARMIFVNEQGDVKTKVILYPDIL
ncbi:MAG: HAD-IA family hydrolase [Acholeplasmataceae bacterium]